VSCDIKGFSYQVPEVAVEKLSYNEATACRTLPNRRPHNDVIARLLSIALQDDAPIENLGDLLDGGQI